VTLLLTTIDIDVAVHFP